MQVDCPVCNGKGKYTIEDIRIDGYRGLPDKKCNFCNGTGKVETVKDTIDRLINSENEYEK